MTKPQWTMGPWRMSRIERPPIGRQANGEPWPTDANGNVFWGYSISGSAETGAAILPTLAVVHNFPSQIDANAHLIAAAPDMAEALAPFADILGEEAVDLPDDTPVVVKYGATEVFTLKIRDFRRSVAALAKARGEA